MKIRIIHFGDLVGKISRKALKKIIPEWRERYKPDIVSANAENAAHGAGITKKIYEELREAGVDFMTLGDHAFDKPEAESFLSEESSRIIRPANISGSFSGEGAAFVDINGKKILFINLLGEVFMKKECENPFLKLDDILKENKERKPDAIIVDFHAEATSEKRAFGWYADGRVSAVLGSHTHVPTADAQTLPNGTAYVSDVGMVGGYESVIGVNKEAVLNQFLKDDFSEATWGPVEDGLCQVNAVLLDINCAHPQKTKVQRIDKTLTV